MNCETCNGKFAEITESNLSIDICASCNVIFFDHLELETYCQRNSFEMFKGEPEIGESMEVSCPKCVVKLQMIRHNEYRFGKCPSCSGYLVPSTMLDEALPAKEEKRPLDELDGFVNLLHCLRCIVPW